MMSVSQSDLQFLELLARDLEKHLSEIDCSDAYAETLLNCVLGKLCTLRTADAQTTKITGLQHAILYLQNHFTEQIKLEDAAKVAGYSSNYFSARFKSYTGVTFKQYLTDLRFSFAKKLLEHTETRKEAVEDRMDQARRRMSAHAAAVRDPQQIQATLEEICRELPQVTDYRLREMLLTQAAVLTAMSQPQKDPELVQEVTWTGADFRVTVRKVRPIPEEDAAFETVWREYRQHKNIY